MTLNNYYYVATKSRDKGMLLSRSASILFKPCGLNSKRTLSTSSEPVAVRVYLNPDKDKQVIVNENKGRAGIYR